MRIELTTLRLWDLRAAYCATEAVGCEVNFSHFELRWKTIFVIKYFSLTIIIRYYSNYLMWIPLIAKKIILQSKESNHSFFSHLSEFLVPFNVTKRSIQLAALNRPPFIVYKRKFNTKRWILCFDSWFRQCRENGKYKHFII